VKGTIAILGCLIAAYAAPLFANEVPLILEETIQLPWIPEAWDVAPTLEGQFRAICARRDDNDSLEVYLNELGLLDKVLALIPDMDIVRVIPYISSTYGLCYGVALQRLEGDYVRVLEIAPGDSDRIVYTYDFQGGLCQAGPPPGLRIYCHPEYGYVTVEPPVPSENQSLVWYLKEKVCSSTSIGGHSIGGCSDHVRFSIPDPDWMWWSERMNGGLITDVFQSSEEKFFACTAYSMSYTDNDVTEIDWAGLGWATLDSVETTFWIRGLVNAAVCTKDSVTGQRILIESTNTSTMAWYYWDPPIEHWYFNQGYQALYCVNLAWTSNEEILGQTPNSRTLDVITLSEGQIWGQTSPLDSGFSEIKVIGRFVDDNRRLAVRYGSELRIYRFGDPILDADDARPELPSELLLSAYPNPFNPTTMIAFDLPKAARANLVVYDLNGRQVQSLFDEQISAGKHEFGFDGANLPSGIYFARLSAGDLSRTHKLVLMK